MKRTVFSGEALSEISFPLGGIGSGSIGIAGNGRFVDWEIFNRPSKGSTNGHTHFAVKAYRDGKLLDARVINGDMNKSLCGDYAHGFGFGYGLISDTMAGFPHFKNCVFNGEFPIATIDFDDDAFPGQVRLTAWNPLIPQNDKDSSIPAAFLEYAVTNVTDAPIDYTVSGTIRNPYDKSVNEFCEKDGMRALHLRQVQHPVSSTEYGDLTLATDAVDGVSYQTYWYRGIWNDGLERYWRNFTESEIYNERNYAEPGNKDHANLGVKMHAEPGETVRVRFVISWNCPNCYNYWSRYTKKDEEGNDVDVTWKNYYASLFDDSIASAEYALRNWNELWKGTERFRDELFSSTLPEEIVEAISATTSVLKTATVMRLENGEFYGWEGIFEKVGSCEGTCTHVWNYAYALCFLFPNLERSIRETDYTYNQDDDGRMSTRMTLPLGRERFSWRACVDGQMGGVIKTYREWKLSGDDAWLKKWWPHVKKAIEYAWSDKNYDGWDRDRDGILEGRQHHTLDTELFGPSSWLEGFYLAALKCGAEMAERVGEPETAADYRSLFENGHKWCEENLFNGKWYVQKLDITDKSYLEKYGDAVGFYWNDESGEIKQQIGEGCLLDQCLAQWHANIIGIGEIFDKEHLHTALESVYRNNFLQSMRSHYNTLRIFALNDEAATIICSYPEGTKVPAIPTMYARESMHGFEYAFAGLLISEGYIDEGIRIVKAVRDRYRGFNRNPYNEIECGSNYARSMASFAFLPIFSGFKFCLPDGIIGFDPILSGDFRAPWFVDGVWGSYQRKDESTELCIVDGALTIRALELPYLSGVSAVSVDGRKVEFSFADGILTFDAPVTVRDQIIIR